jgi:hypothetical protein
MSLDIELLKHYTIFLYDIFSEKCLYDLWWRIIYTMYSIWVTNPYQKFSLQIAVFYSANGMAVVMCEVAIPVTMKNTVFWDVMPCSLVEVYQHIKGMYCLCLQWTKKMKAIRFFQNVGKLLPYNISCILEASILEWY